MAGNPSGPSGPLEGGADDAGDAAELSVGELVSEAGGGLSRLVRLELEMAKLELAHDAKQVGKGSGLFIVAAVFLHLVLVLFSITAGFFLYEVAGLSAWLSFLIVTGFYLLLALILVAVGALILRRMRGLERFSTTMAGTVSLLSDRGAPAAERPRE
ncbi:phage holin family protein [Nocardiopsis coralliicola]